MNVKTHEKEMFNLVFSIFREFQKELPPGLQLIVKETVPNWTGYAQTTTRKSEKFQRIYISRHTLSSPKIFVIHILLHEITHFLVGIHQGHNEVFQKREKELCEKYGIRIKRYSLMTDDGFLAYARLNDLEWISK